MSNIAKLPPQAIELERVVLGSIIANNDLYGQIKHIVEQDTFYSQEHKAIFLGSKQLLEDNKPLDTITLVMILKKNGTLEKAGGAYNISKVANAASNNKNIEYQTKLLYETYAKRRLIQLADELKANSYSDAGDPIQMAIDVQDRVYEIVSKLKEVQEIVPILEMVENYTTQLKKNQDDGIVFNGLETGSKVLDGISGGWQRGDLVIFGAATSMGKSVRAWKMLMDVCKGGGSCAFFSLEMSQKQLASRVVASETGISLNDLKFNNVTPLHWEEVGKLLLSLMDYKFSIQDAPAIDLLKLKSDCEAHKLKYGTLDVIVVDYLQLMTPLGKFNTTNDAVGSISKGLKSIAKELDITVIALSQLSRRLEHRPDKRPIKSDFRDSGQIEQDADLMGYFYRPSYYTDYKDSSGVYREKGYSEDIYNRIFEIGIIKNRQGDLGFILEQFIGEHAKFNPIEKEVIEINPIDINDQEPF